MITVDKEASLAAIEAGKQIFERFGSTRLLAFFCLLAFLLGACTLDRTQVNYALTLGAASFLLLIVSYLRRPHYETKESPGATL